MTGNAATVVAEIAGKRYLITLDKGHRLEIHPAGGQPLVIEGRPVTEFCAAVDNTGKIHIAAWLLSRHMMYYTSQDGEIFTRSTLLKSDAGLRLKDCMIFCGEDAIVAYVAETEHADTLVCYRYAVGDWEGSRIVEVEHPGRLTALQFDGAPGGLSIVYGSKEQGRTVIFSRPLAGDVTPEVVATVTGGLTDFCALTSGGARQSCWVADGHLMINSLRQTEEPWSRTWPCLRREVSGIQCVWMENDSVCGVALGAQRARLKPVQGKEPMPCMLAQPGELRRAIVDGRTLQEISLSAEVPERAQAGFKSVTQNPVRPDGQKGSQGELTLSDIVRNQAIYITRMQESLSAMERNMLRLQAEVNRLSKEMGSVIQARDVMPRQERPYNAAAVREESAPQKKYNYTVVQPASAASTGQSQQEQRAAPTASPAEGGDGDAQGYAGA